MAANPYPGKRPYRTEEAAYFNGREAECKHLLAKIENNPFMALSGPAACGKTSLVQAGILPGHKSAVLQCRPGQQPFSGLVHALLDDERLGPVCRDLLATEDEDTLFEAWAARLRYKPLVEFNALLQAAGLDASSVLLVVDRFEEIFSTTGELREAEDFVDFFLTVSDRKRPKPVHVLVVLRSEFMVDCGLFFKLAEQVEAHHFALQALSPPVLRQGMIQAATRAGGSLDAAVVDALVAENPRRLMMHLQDNLHAVWKLSDGNIRLRHYRQLRGLPEPPPASAPGDGLENSVQLSQSSSEQTPAKHGMGFPDLTAVWRRLRWAGLGVLLISWVVLRILTMETPPPSSTVTISTPSIPSTPSRPEPALNSEPRQTEKKTTEITPTLPTRTNRLVMALDNRGRILIAGGDRNYSMIVRYSSTGQLDSAFGDAGVVRQTHAVTALLPAADGGFWISAHRQLWRRRDNGRMDNSAPWPSRPARRLMFDRENAVLGLEQQGRGIFRHHADGRPDRNFGTPDPGGRRPGLLLPAGADRVTAMTVMADGKIILCIRRDQLVRSKYQFQFIRLTADGQADSGFGIPYVMSLPVSDPDFWSRMPHTLLTQPDQRILVLTDTWLSRLTPHGSIDPQFRPGMTQQLPLTATAGISVEEDGRIIISGHQDQHLQLVRLQADGRLDKTSHTFRQQAAGTEPASKRRLHALAGHVRLPDGRLAVGSVFADDGAPEFKLVFY